MAPAQCSRARPGGGARSREGGKRKESDGEWSSLLRWPERDVPGRRLQDGRLCREGGDGDPRGVGCTCGGSGGGPPVVGVALSSLCSAKDPLPGATGASRPRELEMALGTGAGRGDWAEGWRDCPEQWSARDTGFGPRDAPRSLLQGSHTGRGRRGRSGARSSPNPLPMRPTLERGPRRAVSGCL